MREKVRVDFQMEGTERYKTWRFWQVKKSVPTDF